MWSATANPHSLRRRIAEILSFPEGKIRVIAPDVGGSFGVKIQTYQEELLLPYLSRQFGRPIKWCETRVEHMRNGRHGRDQIHYYRNGVQKRWHDLGYQGQDHRRYGLDLHRGSFDSGRRALHDRRLSDPELRRGCSRRCHQQDHSWLVARHRQSRRVLHSRTARRYRGAPVEARSDRHSDEKFHSRRCVSLSQRHRGALRQRPVSSWL